MTMPPDGAGGNRVEPQQIQADGTATVLCLPPVRSSCNRCGLYPRMDHGLCGACLGREMLGYGCREERTAAIAAAYIRARSGA